MVECAFTSPVEVAFDVVDAFLFSAWVVAGVTDLSVDVGVTEFVSAKLQIMPTSKQKVAARVFKHPLSSKIVWPVLQRVCF